MADPHQMSDAELLAALEWYRAAGVDIAVGEASIDRFAISAPPRAIAVAAAAAIPQPAPSLPLLGTDPDEAMALAAACTTLDELREAFARFEGCALKQRARQICFADGNPQAQIMLLGEAPGEQEDMEGRPFVGRAGRLLDRMLAAIGLDRTKVYIANVVPWRPPGNRNPTPQEMAACAPFLHRQIALVAPKLLLTLGNIASRTIFESTTGIMRLRGQQKSVTIGGHGTTALATLHPAYLLRTPGAKQLAWRDMLALAELIEKENIETG
ncbi:uracil-DNA glycosylase [Arsenicitalea aurantiaca]|uniref:Type-4 uracil-DNA glycosylase n=1 Tax=Arsenicitalea aurantiaca TaxID=1783274 RepID=A0A433XAN1_9HYPH|nr:uracil-DNA glycosylase [Arsenicitalea aurantiaca]RUT31147.1 uracil-DNA glycosylase [Arsenicitalea aurantiaca]